MFIARQPIFNDSMKVYGYELLYRDSETSNSFNDSSAEKATATVLNGLFELGIDNISNDKKSFINFDYDFLFSKSIELIEPENLVIEVLEDTIVDDKLIKRLKVLKAKGYKIALDDFVKDQNNLPLIPIANIIKYDIMNTPLNSIRLEVKKALSDGKILLAEKVETLKDYNLAKKMGFHLFQGFFFEKPRIIGKTNNKKSPKLSYLKLIKELKNSEPSYDELTNIIKTDVNLTYRLINKNDKEVLDSNDFLDKIKKSLIQMGFEQIERWINILMLQDLATNKPLELTRLSFIRAHFGELLAKNSKLKSKSKEIYGMFLFSTLDALLDQPMEKVLKDLSINEDSKQALIDGKGDLSPILKLVHCYEKGDWEDTSYLSKKLKIDKEQITKYYMESLEYCENIMNNTYSVL